MPRPVFGVSGNLLFCFVILYCGLISNHCSIRKNGLSVASEDFYISIQNVGSSFYHLEDKVHYIIRTSFICRSSTRVILGSFAISKLFICIQNVEKKISCLKDALL